MEDKRENKNHIDSKGSYSSSESRKGTSDFPGGRRFGGPGSVMPVVKAKDVRGTTLRLWQFYGRERGLLILIFSLVVISASIALSVPYLIGLSIDAMSITDNIVDFKLLAITVSVLLTAYIIDGALHIIQGWLMAGFSQRIVKDLRRTIFAKLQKLPVAFFDTRTHGELMSRLANDVDNVSSTISQATIQLMLSSITIIGSFVMMLALSPLLTAASIITIPMVFFLTRAIAKRTKILFKEQQRVLGALNGHVEEMISGIEVVKAFNQEENAVSHFKEINNKLCKVGIKAQIWTGFIMPLMNVINNIGFAVVAGVGGALAVRDLITIGVIASFLSYSRQFSRPLNELANIFNTLQSAIAGAERVFEVLDEKEEILDVEGAKLLENPKGHVVFNKVFFGYRKDVPVLRNISFDAPQGSTVALVGPTGAGKTTIVNLLARFYDVTSGSIFIDSTDIREYTRDSLRNCFGIVLQDTYLFSGTISENIRYGRQEASQEEIEAAAVMANADVFIKRLPEGYNTILSESGGNLSQGQRQLLAIARAILSNPSILILDEATSSVDTRTELHIQEAMLKLRQGRTSFIIAHRLSTIRDADIIMVIDGGEIVEKGNHEELMNKKGEYYMLHQSQFSNTLK
jgi:ATP-binding cassette, subfamily B, multidrug efflux pump